jgi:hypothetical protein
MKEQTERMFREMDQDGAEEDTQMGGEEDDF